MINQGPMPASNYWLKMIDLPKWAKDCKHPHQLNHQWCENASFCKSSLFNQNHGKEHVACKGNTPTLLIVGRGPFLQDLVIQKTDVTGERKILICVRWCERKGASDVERPLQVSIAHPSFRIIPFWETRHFPGWKIGGFGMSRCRNPIENRDIPVSNVSLLEGIRNYQILGLAHRNCHPSKDGDQTAKKPLDNTEESLT